MQGAQSTALIAAGSRNLRESLRAMIVSMLPDALIVEASDTASAERLLRELHPNLVIIDGDLAGSNLMELVVAARAAGPEVRCSILVDSVYQQAVAMKAGAHHVPFKGEPPTRLFAQVEQLLQPH